MYLPKPNWINKDYNLRQKFSLNEIKKLLLKSLLFNSNFKFFFKIYFDKKFKKFTKYTSISRYRTSCAFLYNSRAVIRKFKMSRHSCKKYASHGFLSGLKKSSF